MHDDPCIPLREIAAAWLRHRIPTLVVRIVAVRGSAPREAGATLLVAADAQAGTLGGGHLEWQAVHKARALLSQTTPALPGEDTVSLGASLGQCCGGVVTLRYETLDAASLAAWWPEKPRFHLMLHGAGHVGRALVAVLSALPCRIDWIDCRDEAFTGFDPTPRVIPLITDTPQAEIDAAPPGTWQLVMTHDHGLDLALAETILRRQRRNADVGGFGLIGSAAKRARFRQKLAARGFAEAELDFMRCPVGLPGIAGKEPGVIAIAIAAELLQTTAVVVS
jgi:xanthine dehydrogenase accessory factor